MISQKNYITRRRNLVSASTQDVIILTGSEHIQKSSDDSYEFFQDGYFYYLTGISEPGWMLVIDEVKGTEVLIHTNESSYHDDLWDGHLSREDVTRISGIEEIVDGETGWALIKNDYKNHQSIGTLVPPESYSKAFGMFINPAKITLKQKLEQIHPDANLVDIGGYLRTLRAVKEPEEIAIIKDCISVTEAALSEIEQNLGSYTNEAEIYADITAYYMRRGYEHGYKPIVASGRNAATLHYKHNNQPLVKNNFILIDTGASKERYTADISRTYQYGKQTSRQQDVYDAVRESYDEILPFLRPGISMIDIQAHADQIVGNKLIELGVTDNLLRNTIREYFPHAFGHHLGIDIHDSCPYDEPLQPGAVITLEPGIYIASENIGVRIEDNLCITEDGCEVLSGKGQNSGNG